MAAVLIRPEKVKRMVNFGLTSVRIIVFVSTLLFKVESQLSAVVSDAFVRIKQCLNKPRSNFTVPIPLPFVLVINTPIAFPLLLRTPTTNSEINSMG